MPVLGQEHCSLGFWPKGRGRKFDGLLGTVKLTSHKTSIGHSQKTKKNGKQTKFTDTKNSGGKHKNDGTPGKWQCDKRTWNQ